MAWGYKASITVDNTKVSGTGDLSNFPILISGTYDGTGTEPDLRATAHGGNVTSDNGYDIAFYSDSGLTTQLHHEIESFDHTTGVVNFWVNIPTLDGDADTVIYMAYGDAGVTTDPSSTDTWVNYKYVHHMKDASTTTVADSTGNSVTLTKTSDGNPAEGTGIVGKGETFSSDKLQYDDTTGLTKVLNNFSLEMWAIPTSTSAQAWMYKGENLYGFAYSYAKGGAWWGVHYHGGLIETGTTAKDEYAYLAYVCDSAVGQYFYKNGAENITNTEKRDIVDSDTATLYISTTNGTSYPAIGTIDEVRLSSVVRSADWIATTYESIKNVATFYAMGDEGTTNAVPNTPTNTTPANSATGVIRNPVLEASAFDDPDVGDTHAASQWQIATDSGFTDTVWDSGEDAVNLTTTTVNSSNGTFGGTRTGLTRLAGGTLHYWKVRYKDSAGGWSLYS
jgi:hypothetical protein